MKKVLLLFLCLFLVIGCKEKESLLGEENNLDSFVLEKIDDTKDYVYFQEYKKLVLGIGDYTLGYMVINIQSEDVDNVNLELRSFVIKSYRDMSIYNDVISQGNIISYDSFVTDCYVTILQKYYPYIDGVVGEETVHVYVVSLETGKVLDNAALLEAFQMSEETLYSKIEACIDSDDVSYTMMRIKKDGYTLYVNDSNQLVVLYYEVDDMDSIKKELVLS